MPPKTKKMMTFAKKPKNKTGLRPTLFLSKKKNDSKQKNTLTHSVAIETLIMNDVYIKICCW